MPKPSLKWAWLGHVKHLNFGEHHISETADRLRCCQFRWTVGVVSTDDRRRSPVYHTGRQHLCTVLRRAGMSATAKACSFFSRPWFKTMVGYSQRPT